MKILILILSITSMKCFAQTCEKEIQQLGQLTSKKSVMESQVANGLTDVLADIEIVGRRISYIKNELKSFDHMSSEKALELEKELERLSTKMTKFTLKKSLLERRMRDTYDAFHAAVVLKNTCLYQKRS